MQVFYPQRIMSRGDFIPHFQEELPSWWLWKLSLTVLLSLDARRAFTHTVQRRGDPSHKAAKESSIFFIAMLY